MAHSSQQQQQHHAALDPQLAASSYDQSQNRLPSIAAVTSATGGFAKNDHAPTQPSPYYQFPSPQSHTPQQHGSLSAGLHNSSQTSPQDAEYHGEASPDDGEADPNNPDDPKRPRACESCRGLKVRCDQDPTRPDLPCKRCAKAGRQCIITQPSRKRQKKADSRVAELEKKLDALTAALQSQQQIQGYAQPGQEGLVYSQPPTVEPEAGPPTKRRRTEDHSYSSASVSAYPVLDSPDSRDIKQTDPKHHGKPFDTDLTSMLHKSTPKEFLNRINALIPPDVAPSIFERYKSELCPHMPAVVIPEGVTAASMFKEKPILYVCIMSVASFGILGKEKSGELTREAIGAIADTTVRNGAKSLELIQAMQVMALWYKPPENAEQTNFYQIIHMASVMALDIGLGRRFNPAKARRGFGGPHANYAPGPHRMLPQDSDTLEARRAWLACYYLCASASMVLRRPNLVRWSNYMKECIEVLETHPDALPSDKLFCQHIKIQHICEEIGLQFLMDDSSANISITDPKVTYALNILENQLKSWKENIPPECRSKALIFFEHVTSLYLHEIALHFNHNIEDFRLPFTEESLKSVNSSTETLTTGQIAALEACLKASHGMMDIMLSFDRHTINQLPLLLYFVRCVYAIVILVKMHVAVTAPNSEVGKMIKVEDLKVEYYLESLRELFESVAQITKDFRPHPKMLMILTMLRDWFVKHKESLATNAQPSTKAQAQEGGQFNQTPLHLLSQVATGNTQSTNRDWTFSSPSAVDYSKRPQGYPTAPPTTSTNSTASGPNVNYPTPGSFDNQQAQMPVGMPDQLQDFGWGNNFEQALDIALGSVNGLQDGGLDQWFLGDNMMPFGDFNASMTGNWQQQQQQQ